MEWAWHVAALTWRQWVYTAVLSQQRWVLHWSRRTLNCEQQGGAQKPGEMEKQLLEGDCGCGCGQEKEAWTHCLQLQKNWLQAPQTTASSCVSPRGVNEGVGLAVVALLDSDLSP